MTTTAAQATEDFINSDRVQDAFSNFIRNANEQIVAKELNVTRREARGLLKITGRW